MSQRNTVQKSLILNAVHRLANHPTAEQVYDYIKEENPSVSRATVYRNLNKLADCGSIKKVEVFGSADRFDHNISEHYHFICKKCGAFCDIEIPYIEHLNTDYHNFGGRVINRHQILFDGLCEECAKQ